MKFKVTARTVDTISVQFEDGSNAVVPIAKGQTKQDILLQVGAFSNSRSFDKVSDVPVEVGDTWLEYEPEDPIQDYRSARSFHYPPTGKQLGALYWAREGDDTELKAVDAAIKLVKETIPKGTTYKTSEIAKLMD